MLDIKDINNHIMIDWKMSVHEGVITLTKGHNLIDYSHNGDGIDYLYTYSGAVKDIKSRVNASVSDIAEIINYGDTKHDTVIHNTQTKKYSLRGYTVLNVNDNLLVTTIDGDVVSKPYSVDEAIQFIRNI